MSEWHTPAYESADEFLGITVATFAADAPAPKAEEIVKSYTKALTPLTETPKSLGAEFAGTCRMVPIDKTAGPHRRAYARYFRDAVAQQPGDRFPVGSILVKEKLVQTKIGGLKVEAVAGMIKRGPATHPKSGDWEFFWFENGKVTTTGMESCAGCHSGAKKDYVFTDFPKKAEKR